MHRVHLVNSRVHSVYSADPDATIQRKKAIVVAASAGPSAAKRALALLSLIEKRKKTIARAFWDVGVALRELLRKKLYASLGHVSFAEMLKARGVMGKTYAFQLIGVIDSFTKKEALGLGQKKAMSLVRLARATAADDTPSELAREGAIVRGERVDPRLLSASALERQSKRVRQNRRAAKDDPAREEAHKAAERVERRLRAHGVAAEIRVFARRGALFAEVRLPVASLARLRVGRAQA